MTIKRDQQSTTFKNENKKEKCQKNTRIKQEKEKPKKNDRHAKTNKYEKMPNRKGNEQTSFFFDLEKCVS